MPWGMELIIRTHTRRETEREQQETTYVKNTRELPVATKFDVDALCEGKLDQVEGLGDS